MIIPYVLGKLLQDAKDNLTNVSLVFFPKTSQEQEKRLRTTNLQTPSMGIKFSDLPIELRITIWDLVPCDSTSSFTDIAFIKPNRFSGVTKSPPEQWYNTCAESRQRFLRKRQFLFLTNSRCRTHTPHASTHTTLSPNPPNPNYKTASPQVTPVISLVPSSLQLHSQQISRKPPRDKYHWYCRECTADRLLQAGTGNLVCDLASTTLHFGCMTLKGMMLVTSRMSSETKLLVRSISINFHCPGS